MSPAEFKKLQAKWDKKLKQSGFKDIEDRRFPYGMLSDSLNDVRKAVKADRISGVDEEGASYSFSPTSQFYAFRQQFLNEQKFKTKGDRLCFELSTEGLTPAKIYKEMKRRQFRSWTYWRVRYSLDVSNRRYNEWIANGRRHD